MTNLNEIIKKATDEFEKKYKELIEPLVDDDPTIDGDLMGIKFSLEDFLTSQITLAITTALEETKRSKQDDMYRIKRLISNTMSYLECERIELAKNELNEIALIVNAMLKDNKKL